jgi:hypothetical protein
MLSSYRYGGTVLSGFGERPTVAVGDPFLCLALMAASCCLLCSFQAAPSIHGLRLFINHLKLHLCIDDTEVTPLPLSSPWYTTSRSEAYRSRFQVQITDSFFFVS